MQDHSPLPHDDRVFYVFLKWTMNSPRQACLTATLFLKILLAAPAQACLGEFTPCKGSGECVMDDSLCGNCKTGEYLCPSDQSTCVKSVQDYVKCPGMKGHIFY